jgi:antitoxin MazE
MSTRQITHRRRKFGELTYDATDQIHHWLACSALQRIFIADPRPVQRSAEVLVRARVQRWGNSLALRIAEALAAETALESGSEVELTLAEGRLVGTPVARPSDDLDELLGRVSRENLHAEVDAGGGIGGEAC